MATVTQVGITNGVPTSGTGEVSTIDAAIAVLATASGQAALQSALEASGFDPGQAAKAASLSVTIASDDDIVGIKTETAPATDTASSGLNGRLQRIAQRITSLIAMVAPLLTSAGDTSVQTAATGSNWTAFGSQACKQLTLINNTTTSLSVRHGSSGSGFPLPDNAGVTLRGLSNTSGVEVKRADSSNSQVTLYGFWEA